MVRLTARDCYQEFLSMVNFNSAMVRLTDQKTNQDEKGNSAFQFRNGSINSRIPAGIFKAPWHFNSAMVRLTVLATLRGYEAEQNFNSAMVRLTERRILFKKTGSGDFNSAMVRLTEGMMAERDIALENFNSAMLRLTVLR